MCAHEECSHEREGVWVRGCSAEGQLFLEEPLLPY